MSKSNYPGVYIEEIGGIPPSIAQVETAIPVFIGYAQTAGSNMEFLFRPKRIKSLLEYEEIYGAAFNEALEIEVNENQTPKSITITNAEQLGLFKMYYSLKMFYANGGGDCYIVSVGDYSSETIDPNSLLQGLKISKNINVATLIVFPDAIRLSNYLEFYNLYQEALIVAHLLKDRFVIMDTFSDHAYLEGANMRDPIEAFRNHITLDIDYLQYGAAYFPFLKTSLQYHYSIPDTQIKYIDISGHKEIVSLSQLQIINTALYKKIKHTISNLPVILPPSSVVAAVYCKVDRDRGVWKAPANVGLNSVLEPTVTISNQEQDNLNIDPVGGKSINAIRAFSGKGILVWGSRTLAGNDNEWRYISVRRFFNMVEESVSNALKQFVFEPNDANTWASIKTMIDNFLIHLFRQGALQGSKPDHAFFVKVGLGETMTAQDILDKNMIIEIGMAVVRPAEFIILRIQQNMQQ